MPSLPNADNATVASEKLTRYLLSRDHPKGRDKAAFLENFGFRLDAWDLLEAALLEHARTYDAAALPPTVHGTKYVVTGQLHCPDGRLPNVKTVWIIDAGTAIPRFVSAIPD